MSAAMISYSLTMALDLRACFGSARRSRQLLFRELTLKRFHAYGILSYNTCSEDSLRPLTSRLGREEKGGEESQSTEAGQPTAGQSRRGPRDSDCPPSDSIASSDRGRL